jgi:hypothetical protein
VLALFFHMSTTVLVLLLLVAAAAAVGLGVLLGRVVLRRRSEQAEGVGIIQAALFGIVGLLLAFGLSMALARFEERRIDMVDEANAIGTLMLRTSLLGEADREAANEILDLYTDAVVRYSEVVPGSDEFSTYNHEVEGLASELWSIGASAMDAHPEAHGPFLFVEALNDAFDVHGTRTAGLINQVPDEVSMLMLLASCAALAALGMHLSVVGRGLISSMIAALVVVSVLVVSLDLDRPHRGLIIVPDGPLVELRDSFHEAP